MCGPKTLTNSPPFSYLSSSHSHHRRLQWMNKLSTSFPLSISLPTIHYHPLSLTTPPPPRPNPIVCAGRSKKKPSTGRIEGDSTLRREAKRNARRRSRQLAESLFYRLKNPNKNQADNFTQQELEMIGLGYDRMVRFMDKDDPNLRHPYDWYKYGQFGPYSWRGIVVGDPIRGRFSDECVTMIGEVKDHEEWEEIEQFDMATEFSKRLNSMDASVGFRYFWVFVRHPSWKFSQAPWEQWTLVSEVAVEASSHKRLDKWNLMGRFGNGVRAAITKCAAWMRPDILYVKRPVYQCRFEPQADFFRGLQPLLDPTTEQNYLFELRREDGMVDMTTYFGGLCKIVKVNPKAFVDDLVKAYEKLNDENKIKCLEFLLKNHPFQLLHPYTKEWKAKLEEMEFGCDAPDHSDEDNSDEIQISAGVNDDYDFDDDDDDDDEDDDNQEDIIIHVESEDEGLGKSEEVVCPEESEKYWEEEFKKALSSNEAMEGMVKKSIIKSTELYKKQLNEMENNKHEEEEIENMREKRERIRPKVYKDEWDYVGSGTNRRRIKRNRIPKELFLRAAVRPFTYKNLVKEIVLMRHAIIDGDITSRC